MAEKEDNPPNIRLVAKSLLYVALAVAVFLGSFQVVKFAAGTETPLLVVVSGSMEPTLKVGDLVVIRHLNAEELEVGDIIVFHNPVDPAELIVHRIDEVVDHSGDRCFLTKGDNNPQQDQRAKGWPPVCPEDIEGRTVAHVPALGSVSLFMESLGDAKYVIIFVLALLIIFSDVWPSRKERSDEKEQRSNPEPVDS